MNSLAQLDGVLLLDKPLSLTSNGALQRIKRLFRAKKAGHTGSLDPLATGMLPICFGEATKLSQYLLESDKTYQVTVKFGEKTTTGDAEGEIIATHPVNFTEEKLREVLTQFVGVISQIPPMYSAIKHQGKPLYELARKGIEVERAPRNVTIYLLRLDEFTGDTASLYVHCTKGTYIRTLVEDMGEKLGCGAHVSGLRRVFVSPYQEAKMYTLAELEDIYHQQGLDALRRLVLPLETSVQGFPAVKLAPSTAFYIRTGQPVMVPHAPVAGLVRIFSDDTQFIGIGEILDDGRIAPKRIFKSPVTLAKAVGEG